MPAGCTIRSRIVTTAGEGVIDAKFEASTDDLRFRQVEKGSMDGESLLALNPGFGIEVCHALIGFEILWSTIGVATIVKGINPDEEIISGEHLGPGQGK